MNAKTRFATTLAAGALAATTFTACGGDTGGPEPQPVDHATTRQAVQANTEGASQSLADAVRFTRQTKLLGEWVDDLDGVSVDCATDGGFESGTGSTDGSGSIDCEASQPEPVETEIEDGTQQLVDLLNNRIFVDANIEQESNLEITYLLDGQTVCVAEDFETAGDRQDCVDEVDQLQVRLVVTSLADGDVDIEVLVGPDRFNPLDLELHQNLLAAATDLAELRSTIVFAANVTGDDLQELPSTMRGQLRAELRHDANGKLVGSLSVLQNVNISDADYELTVSKAQPAGQITVDPTAQTISGLLDLNPVDLRMPVTETETTWDSATGEETTTETSYEIAAHLGGASFDATYAVGSERVDVQNVGLGNSTSTLDIDGKRVASVDLNRSHGRHLNFSLVAGENGMELSVSPAFDLELMLQFAQVQDKLDDIDDWMLDDLLRITLDGAANPAVRIGDSGIEVVEGNLTLSSTSAGVTVDAAAGQCILGPEGDEPTPITQDGSTDGSSTPTEEPASHPFEELTAGSCQ